MRSICRLLKGDLSLYWEVKQLSRIPIVAVSAEISMAISYTGQGKTS